MPDTKHEYRGFAFVLSEGLQEKALAENGVDVIAEIQAAIDYQIDVVGEKPEQLELFPEEEAKPWG